MVKKIGNIGWRNPPDQHLGIGWKVDAIWHWRVALKTTINKVEVMIAVWHMIKAWTKNLVEKDDRVETAVQSYKLKMMVKYSSAGIKELWHKAAKHSRSSPNKSLKTIPLWHILPAITKPVLQQMRHLVPQIYSTA
jgi:hypothetical protein